MNRSLHPSGREAARAPHSAGIGPPHDRHRKKRRHLHKHKAKSAPVKSDINVTPLVDVVLVLLIIFMVVTPMLHRGVDLELPSTRHHSTRQDTGEQLVVSVRADGAFLEADKVDLEKLGS